jgi:predicted ArsR family transcriptional regulator
MDRASAPASDVVGRDAVTRCLMVHGPATASVVADRLGVSATVVRRHLDHLLDDGLVEARERAPYGPSPARRRGRPARVFALTPSGRETLPAAYDALALAALQHVAAREGDEGVRAFARTRAEELETALTSELAAGGPDDDPVAVVAAALSELGFAASVDPAPGGHQLCQHHCPVSHVAEEFPELCEAETQALGHVLGRHVQRLATIAHGDGVCTTVIPAAPSTRSTT